MSITHPKLHYVDSLSYTNQPRCYDYGKKECLGISQRSMLFPDVLAGIIACDVTTLHRISDPDDRRPSPGYILSNAALRYK